jgi:hypothetical protein
MTQESQLHDSSYDSPTSSDDEGDDEGDESEGFQQLDFMVGDGVVAVVGKKTKIPHGCCNTSICSQPAFGVR